MHLCQMGGCCEVLGGAASSSSAVPATEPMLFVTEESLSATRVFVLAWAPLRRGAEPWL